ncbi:MAG: monovalent cation/H+ antiporter subunit A [Rhodobacteraceae bacterium]|jgi:multicomponent K+:H+ antiporter subunit A|nr:monovalent cation/H+ antiporter subunit A [Paracoccaceae bacterium]
MSPVLIAALPFLGALLAGLAARAGRTAVMLAAGLCTAAALAGLIGHWPAIAQGTPVTAAFDWLPQVGLEAAFRIDGLALMFAGMILGIGILILIYARYYMGETEDFARFIVYLMLFQGAMTGIVLSDNLLLLLVSWELTSLTSFLLIGWWRDATEARQGARMALAVTAGGGLALMAGLLILGQIAGTYSISGLAAHAEAIQASPAFLPALILILLGAFTKSAQFPFHFWLPRAMAAPTPVSAYLHSATMVKAGLFLMARLWPVLAGGWEWTAIVATTGLLTMVIAAKIAFFQDDMKALLAYSTVSHLGLITFLLGLGTEPAALAAVVHILAHASFKAALFLTAGIVDHETGTRRLSRLGGLARVMPLTFGVAAVASLSMAGVPPLAGFLSKEMALEEAAHATVFGLPWLVALIATIGAAWSVGYSLRFLVHGFLGQPREDMAEPPHDPGAGLLISPMILAALTAVGGIVPMQVLAPLADVAASAVTGLPVHGHLALWHGLDSAALWMSLAAFGAGVAFVALWPQLSAMFEAAPKLDAKRMFDAVIGAITALARRIDTQMHDGNPVRSFALAVPAMVAVGLWAFLGTSHLPGDRAVLSPHPAAVIGWAVLMLATLTTAIVHRARLFALLLTAAVGLVLALAYAVLSAPDLALTQISVEVVATLLMLLALSLLPRVTPAETPWPARLRDAAIAAAAGIGIAALALSIMLRNPAFPPISIFHWAQSKPGAGGTNAVNTIIVDFRGYDTYGEITVLGIAALVIFAMATALLSNRRALARLRRHDTGGNSGDPHPQIVQVAVRFLLPLALVVALYIFLRGHNLPGGGFVAGLVVAIGLLLQYIASGFAWVEMRRRLSPHALIGAGILVATATGAVAWGFGRPFLTSTYGHVILPVIGDIELASAAAFDLGVFLCVLGAVVLAIAALARLGAATTDGEEEEG